MNEKWSGFDVNHMTNKFRCGMELKHTWELLLTQTFPLLYSTEWGVTDEDRRLILEEHNYLRQTVARGNVPGQPAAQNMQEMRWDDELAAKAQQWANECTFQHDPSRYLGEFKYRRDTAKPRRGFPFTDDNSTEIKHFLLSFNDWSEVQLNGNPTRMGKYKNLSLVECIKHIN